MGSSCSPSDSSDNDAFEPPKKAPRCSPHAHVVGSSHGPAGPNPSKKPPPSKSLSDELSGKKQEAGLKRKAPENDELAGKKKEAGRKPKAPKKMNWLSNLVANRKLQKMMNCLAR